jgi:hypothetical protein
MVDAKGKAARLTLTAQKMGATPKQLFEKAVKTLQHVPVVPGTVVGLLHSIGNIEPGYFVFLGEEKSEMLLSRAGEDEDGDIVVTDEVHRVHVDFRNAVEVREIGPNGAMSGSK